MRSTEQDFRAERFTKSFTRVIISESGGDGTARVERLRLPLHVEYLAQHVKGELKAPGSDGEHAETAWLAENFGHLETVEIVNDDLQVICSSMATAMPKGSWLRTVDDHRAANYPVKQAAVLMWRIRDAAERKGVFCALDMIPGHWKWTFHEVFQDLFTIIITCGLFRPTGVLRGSQRHRMFPCDNVAGTDRITWVNTFRLPEGHCFMGQGCRETGARAKGDFGKRGGTGFLTMHNAVLGWDKIKLGWRLYSGESILLNQDRI